MLGPIFPPSLRDTFESQRNAATNTAICQRCHSEKGWLDFASEKGELIHCLDFGGVHGPFVKERVMSPKERRKAVGALYLRGQDQFDRAMETRVYHDYSTEAIGYAKIAKLVLDALDDIDRVRAIEKVIDDLLLTGQQCANIADEEYEIERQKKNRRIA